MSSIYFARFLSTSCTRRAYRRAIYPCAQNSVSLSIRGNHAEKLADKAADRGACIATRNDPTLTLNGERKGKGTRARGEKMQKGGCVIADVRGCALRRALRISRVYKRQRNLGAPQINVPIAEHAPASECTRYIRKALYNISIILVSFLQFNVVENLHLLRYVNYPLKNKTNYNYFSIVRSITSACSTIERRLPHRRRAFYASEDRDARSRIVAADNGGNYSRSSVASSIHYVHAIDKILVARIYRNGLDPRSCSPSLSRNYVISRSRLVGFDRSSNVSTESSAKPACVLRVDAILKHDIIKADFYPRLLHAPYDRRRV